MRSKLRLGIAATVLLSSILGVTPRHAGAQDTHYWSNQYGPRSMLLGGLVIGSVNDMSSTYYNPGAMGYIEKPELLLSANVYQAGKLTIEDGAGQGFDLTSSNIDPLPNMVAGAVRMSWMHRNKFAYSILTRHRFDSEIRGTRVTQADILPDVPGDEHFAGAVTFASEANELWVGVTWGRALLPKVGVGVTQYLTVRQQEADGEIFAQALSDSGDIALAFDVNNYEYDDYSFLWKIGMGFDLSPVTLGFTVTTPKAHLTGKGDSGRNATRVGIDLDGDGTPDNAFVADAQEGVSARHKSPLSVGIGGAVRLGGTRIHAAVQWFDKIETYDVLELDPFRSQAANELIQPYLRDAAVSVTNWGIGFENSLGKSSLGYLTFYADNSANAEESDISVTGYDLYHLVGGASSGFGGMRFTGGLGYAWGSETIDQLIDLDPGGAEGVVNPADRVKLSYRQVTFIFGFKVDI